MSKTLRTSGNYTVKAGDGFNAGTGEHTIKLDARYVRVPGDLVVEGNTSTLDTANLSIEDQFIELNRNNSIGGEDSGIVFNNGPTDGSTTQYLHKMFYFDSSENEFVLASTTDTNISAISSPINPSSVTPVKLKIAHPTHVDHAATKSYVDQQTSSAFTLSLRGDDSTVSVTSGGAIYITGDSTGNITSAASEEDTLALTLSPTLTNISSITNDVTNGNLTLATNGSGSVVVDNILTFSSNATTPTATAQTKLYAKAPAGGGTGLFFVNSSLLTGEDELISKKKAVALSIALG